MADEKNKWDSISIDIETLGNKTGAIIASIGLSAFNQNGGPLGPELALYPSLTEQELEGLRVDVDTFKWWMVQGLDAQQEVLRTEDERELMVNVVRQMDQFIYKHLEYGGAVWVKGPSFDFSLMRAAFAAFGLKEPWNFRAERDVRTIKHMFPDYDLYRSAEDVPHTALGDARHQARFVQGAVVAFERIKEASSAWPSTDEPQMS